MAAWLSRVGVSANAVTATAALASVALGVALATTGSRWLLLAYPVFLLVRMALNAIDGMLAREFSAPTPLGALLNETGDLVSDAGLYLPLALVFPAPPWLLVCLVTVALIGEAIGITTRTIGASRRYDGPLGKSDRAAVLSVLAICVFIPVPGSTWWMPTALAILLVLAGYTAANRIRAGLREVRW